MATVSETAHVYTYIACLTGSDCEARWVCPAERCERVHALLTQLDAPEKAGGPQKLRPL
jgi:hypothetical protein